MIFHWWGKEAKGAGFEGHRRHCIWKGFRPKGEGVKVLALGGIAPLPLAGYVPAYIC